MKEFKGTPGPWVWHTGNSSSWLGRKSDIRSDGAVIDDGSACGEYCAVIDVNGCDAKLIAAAPELLSVLQKIVESGHILPHLKIESQWVIAKALGEQP